MLTRLFLGIIKGVLAGSLVALAMVMGFGIVSWGATLAYISAMGLGVLTAVVSGNAIWRKEAGVENAIKAVAGIGIACVGMFALRKWLSFPVDLSMIHGGAGKLGDLPAAALPMVGTLLALMFELDNTGESRKDSKRVEQAANPKARVAEVKVGDLELDESELEAGGRSAQTARRAQRR